MEAQNTSVKTLIQMGTRDVVSWMNIYQNLIASCISDSYSYLIVLKSGHVLLGTEDKDTWNGDMNHSDWVGYGEWDITEVIPELDADTLDEVTHCDTWLYYGGLNESGLISNQKDYGD